MNEYTSWKSNDIQKVNNFLIIKGNKLLRASNDPERVYRACYALPSDPDKMNDWVYRHLNENEAQELYDFCFLSSK
jgi:hypothetical protein